MGQYISKSALAAEIKRRKELVSDPILSGNDLMIGERNAYFNLLSFLDTLEVKEVESEDERIRKGLLKMFNHYVRNNIELNEYDLDKDMVLAWLEKQGEQKSADKVKPKFHEGDWIVWQDKYYKVNYNGCGYELFDQNGLSILLDYGTIDENAHLWDVTKDAKNGDVLVDVYGNIGIFKQYDDFDWTSYCSLGINGGFQHFEVEHENEKTYPATKEQREQLEKAMADAGYTFDFEKKELNKIEQTPAWSEEDEHRAKDTIYFLDTAKKHYASTVELDACIDWLKTLKERVQPQNTWKPTKEQMKATRLARSFVVDDFGEQPTLSEILMELEEQLQKIKEGQTKN